MIAIDTETHLIGPQCYRTYGCAVCGPYGRSAPPLVCVQYYAQTDDGTQRSGVLSAKHDDWRGIVRAALRGDFGVMFGHHIAYDIGVLWSADSTLIAPTIRAYEADRVTDTMLRAKLLDVATGQKKFYHDASGKASKTAFGLDALARRHLGKGIAGKGNIQLRYREVEDTPVSSWPSEWYQYAIDDVIVDTELYVQQSAAPAAVFVDEYRQARAALWLTLMAAWSVQLDPHGVDTLERVSLIERDGLGKTLVDAGLMTWTLKAGFRKRAKLAQARQQYAYESTGRAVPRTDKGNVSLSRSMLQDSGDDELNEYSAFSAVSYLLSKDIKFYRGACDTMAGMTRPMVDTILETGRVSLSKPALLNLGRKPGVRECIVARNGCVILASDYSGFELCTFAQTCIDLCGRSALADMLNAGIDPHLVIAEQIDTQHRSYDTLRGLYKAGDKQVKDLRQVGKVANFGFPGGLGPATLVFFALQTYGVRITEHEATMLRDAWRRTYPEYKRFFELVSDMVDAGCVSLRRSGRIRGDVRFTNACNTWFQGPAADIAKAAGWRIMRECYGCADSPLFGARIVLFVHDEFVLEVTPERLGACAARVEDLMIREAREWLPDVKIGVESMAMQRYSKAPLPGNKVEIPA